MYSRLCVSKYLTSILSLVWIFTVPTGIIVRNSFKKELTIKIGYGIDAAFFISISWLLYERYRIQNRTASLIIDDDSDDEVQIRIGQLPLSIEMVNLNEIEDGCCSICLETTPTNFCMLKCGHKYHIECLQRHLGYTRNCPLCRAPVSPVSSDNDNDSDSDSES